MPLHKKNPGVGNKTTVFSDTVLVEQEDAQTFSENEEACGLSSLLRITHPSDRQITLVDLGNAIIRSITKAAAGAVTTIDTDLHLAGDFKATEKRSPGSRRPVPHTPLRESICSITIISL